MPKSFFLQSIFLLVGIVLAAALSVSAQSKLYSEPNRPQVHFSPKQKWMNDPNGLIYYQGIYHLFFQHYPDSTVWGPMHWGHAVSKDLVHWKQQPIALYPDSMGYIFSGSAVPDSRNTSGLGKNGSPAIVAIFTHHDPVLEKMNSKVYQNQSLAFSIDGGNTWKKYKNNPVLKNPGIPDFRDPKVCWYGPSQKWIMTLATKDRVTFYSSPDLKKWDKESEFGAEIGAHGGVWECPDLFPLYDGDKEIWVLTVSINPGGPNLGSATQYFLGRFNGKTFEPLQTNTRWVDYGTDNYAGVTFSNTGKRKIFMGWMSNWRYANRVPTIAWRNAATLPREFAIKRVNDVYELVSFPVHELGGISHKIYEKQNFIAPANYDLTKINSFTSPVKLVLSIKSAENAEIIFSNDEADTLLFGFDKPGNRFYIDRSKSGNVGFENKFGTVQYAPRISNDASMDITLFLDHSSIEVFADGGLSVMTSVFFPHKPMQYATLRSRDGVSIKKIELWKLESIWK